MRLSLNYDEAPVTNPESNQSEPAPADKGPVRVSTTKLFGKEHELLIEHEGELYRLRITKNNKLILTK